MCVQWVGGGGGASRGWAGKCVQVDRQVCACMQVSMQVCVWMRGSQVYACVLVDHVYVQLLACCEHMYVPACVYVCTSGYACVCTCKRKQEPSCVTMCLSIYVSTYDVFVGIVKFV